MEYWSTVWNLRYWVILADLVWLCGCAAIRMPAIDPSGERIFLPPPAYTTVDSSEGGLLCPLPRPAFVAPPPATPCERTDDLAGSTSVLPPAIVTTPAAPGQIPAPALSPLAWPLADEPAGGFLRKQFVGLLVLSPTRLVAPVGNEVILKAGICSEDGHFITKQPIQWTLSPGSTGTFLNASSEGRPLRSRLREGPAQLFGTNYAVGWTSTRAEVLTRGTSWPADDVSLVEGQAWLSLTSATDGVSHVIAAAPTTVGWNQRYQKATIHWVDGQWSFPAPAIGRAGQPLLLTTNVTRQTGGTPIQGWLVRYRIIGGPPAALDARGAQAVDVPTDALGNAHCTVYPQSDEPGVTTIQIRIIRTTTTLDDLPELIVGEGTTSVTWNAPRINVHTLGPNVADLNSTVTYKIQISNTGDVPSAGVMVSSVLPFGMEYVSSDPPAQIFGDRLQWNITPLKPLELRSIDLVLRATRSGQVRFCAIARTEGAIEQQSCVTTQVAARALSIEVEGPQQAEVGQTIQFRVTITNTGQQPLANLLVIDRFDRGLRHYDPSRPGTQTPSPIERLLGSLNPGESHRFAVSFVVERAGELCHTLEITSPEGVSERARACVTVSPAPEAQPPEAPPREEPPPEPPAAASLVIRKNRLGPETRQVGEDVDFTIEIRNDGEVTVTNLQITTQSDPQLEPVAASFGARRADNRLHWQFQAVAPGQVVRLQVRYRCQATSPRACTTTTVTTDQKLRRSETSCVQIVAPTEQEPPAEPPSTVDGRQPPAPDIPPRPDDEQQVMPTAGRLELTIHDLGDPVRIGEKATYVIEITNDRNVSDKQVMLTVLLPEGTKQFDTTPPPGIRHTVAMDGRTVTFTPIAELRAHETVTFRLAVVLESAGKAILHAEVKSVDTDQPVTQEEETTVFVR